MNRHDSGRFCTESLESAAKRYKTLGFSIIPLLGAQNPQQPKLPAIKWARFQRTQPSDQELYSWFHNQADVGIGIVCGRVSRLLVLDFDDIEVVSEFRHLHPDLLNTFTVQSGTRGLPHFYYRLPEGRLITTSAYPGVDLRGEGSYVVAPPTCVGNARWVVENDAPIHAISDFELRRMLRFLNGLQPVNVDHIRPVVATIETQVSEFRHLPSADDLIALYRELCQWGRNHALFKVAIKARDAGIAETTCCFMLGSVHARQEGPENEAYGSRYSEALRTIASAYKRPPRHNGRKSVTGLGNAAREWLLGNGCAALARVLDGLYTAGMSPNQYFSERDACQKLASLKIGRRSIVAALKAMMNDCFVFGAVESPPYPPHQANAANRSDDLNNSCEMSRGANRVKMVKCGRPARLYRLPSPKEMSEMIGIKSTASDVISDTNFISPRAYRMALHKQLLERRPGHYARAWLGERLGVSRWTTRRYEKAANLYVKPQFTTQQLSLANASKLPEKAAEAAYGVFLESSNGKRYPAVRGLALKLLKQGFEPVLKQQQANFYAAAPVSVGIPTPQHQAITESVPAPTNPIQPNPSWQSNTGVGIPTASDHMSHDDPFSNHEQQLLGVGIPTPNTTEPIFWLCPHCLDFHVTVSRPETCSRCGCQTDWEVLSPAVWRDPQALKHWWQKRHRDHQQAKHQRALETLTRQETALSPEANALVDKVHREIPGLSLANARKMVREFSSQLIEKALQTVRTRAGLRSPAGFLIAFLKSEQKLILSNNNPGKTVDKRESSIEWVKRLAKSRYLSFIANADDIINLNLDGNHEPSPA